MSVINRKSNHTKNQDIAASHPKWTDVGNGLLQHKRGNYAKVGAFGKLVPQSKHAIRFHLGVIAVQKEEAELFKAVKLGLASVIAPAATAVAA